MPFVRIRWFALGSMTVGLFATLHAQPSGTPDKPLELVRDWTIGAADGPPEYAFGRISQFAATRSGTFFLMDDSDTQLRRYDAAGRYQGLVGRSGAGPGEYRMSVALAMHGDSLLLVYDPSNGRISVFDTTGAYRRSIAFARGSFFGEKSFAVDRNGLIYIKAILGRPVESPALPTQYVRMRLNGTLVDSLPLPVGEGEGRPFVLITVDGARWSFPDRMVYAVLPGGGLVTAQASRYRISVPEPGGPPRVLVRPDPRIPLGDAERAEWEAFAKFFASRPGATQTSTIPRVKPSIRDLLVDNTGRIWVHVYTVGVKRDIPPRPAGDPRPLLTIREPNVFDVFAREGTYLGRVELPPHSLLLGIGTDRIWVRTEREAGEQVLTRYRIPALTKP